MTRFRSVPRDNGQVDLRVWTPYIIQLLAVAFFAGFGWNAIDNIKTRVAAVETASATRAIAVSGASERLAAIEAKLDFIINRQKPP